MTQHVGREDGLGPVVLGAIDIAEVSAEWQQD